ncbi:hypothetical protein Aab01nite_82380 [Paractinoplanes abujensis]|uniref:Uncharacterized protein n=1 Tax=Paractinoplanes abujensis TaxID=882441 RepID=A0A7W7CMP4_9ACTN|nr:DUF5988 family protein [Actinoplanes abujensis]MBB4689945.1 hypothetical protein [Actinoplanes abujensis]GID24648.1 hypothetical protein Aab01nite_82380 [Actinoplanes abujensis]
MSISEARPESEATIAALIGGPESLPEQQRRAVVTPGQLKVKVPHYGGYEHFERDDSLADDLGVAFRWTGRTRVAE